MGKCIYNPTWRSKYKWVTATVDKHKAMCSACRKDIDIGTMGESALKSHEKSAKHLKISASIPLMDLKLFGVKTEEGTVSTASKSATNDCPPKSNHNAAGDENQLTIPPPPPAPVVATLGLENAHAGNTMLNLVSKSDVLKSEILWTLHTVVTHNSFKSNEHIK